MYSYQPRRRRREKEQPSTFVRPKPQVSFTKFQRTCPSHVKARCGRCFCNHPIRGGKKNVRCTKASCPFYTEAAQLMGGKRSRRTEYRVPRRYRGVIRR